MSTSNKIGGGANQADGWAAVGQMKAEMASDMAQNQAIGAINRQATREQGMISLRNSMAETEAKMVKGAGDAVKGLA